MPTHAPHARERPRRLTASALGVLALPGTTRAVGSIALRLGSQARALGGARACSQLTASRSHLQPLSTVTLAMQASAWAQVCRRGLLSCADACPTGACSTKPP
jgi:hypothetical protein